MLDDLCAVNYTELKELCMIILQGESDDGVHWDKPTIRFWVLGMIREARPRRLCALGSDPTTQ